MEEDNSKKSIVGLSFRDISETEKASSEVTSDEEIEQSNFLFVDNDIKKGFDLSTIPIWWERIKEKYNTRRGFLAFIIDFVEYLSSRLRIFLVLLSVLSDIVTTQIDSIKNVLVRKMFWGRGSFMSSVIQSVLIVFALVITLSFVYRTPAITSANEDNLDYIDVPETDLIVMNGSLNTLVPKDRERRNVEYYIVKNGDTISTIAEYYNISTETILWANSMSSSSYIKVGQKLAIPPADGVIITVKSGDTLASLSKKYNGNEQSIADFNWLDYPFTLTEGQILFIPDGQMPAPVRTVVASRPSTYVSSSYNASGYSGGVADPNVGKFLSWPVAGGKVSQCYKGSLHRGVDIADSSLPSILAAAAGKIIFAGCTGYCPPLGSTWGGSGYAWAIQVDHGNGYTTFYAHLKNIYVRTGDYVSKGQAIGQLGSTGRSTGPHVHFELRKGVGSGTQINPVPYFDIGIGCR